jgi:hypothetical protein
MSRAEYLGNSSPANLRIRLEEPCTTPTNPERRKGKPIFNSVIKPSDVNPGKIETLQWMIITDRLWMTRLVQSSREDGRGRPTFSVIKSINRSLGTTTSVSTLARNHWTP